MTTIGADLATWLRTGLAHHQAGRRDEAEAMYRRVLAADPAYAEALQLLGILALEAGRADHAETSFRRAIAADGANAAYHLYLGHALYQLDRPAEAEPCYREALRLRPGIAGGQANLGAVLLDLGRPAEAETALRQALASAPHEPGILSNLGIACHQQGRPADAEAPLRQALALAPRFPSALNNLGAVLQELGRPGEAEVRLREALALQPDYIDAKANLGRVLLDLDRPAQAERALREALVGRPNDAATLNNLGVALTRQDRPDEAEAPLRAAVDLSPDRAGPMRNLGPVLCASGRFAEAVALLRAAIRLEPEHPDGHTGLAQALLAQRDVSAAIGAAREAVRVAPDAPAAHVALATTLLTAGRLAEGWEVYERRWATPHMAVDVRHEGAPLWNGAPLRGRTLLVHSEQGQGDTIQFCRYAALVAKAAGGRVVVEVQASLIRLLSSLKGVDAVIARGEASPPFDLHCPMLSLPRVMADFLDRPPSTIPYLAADAGQAALWRERLTSLHGLKVGLVWAGGTPKTWGKSAVPDRRRSLSLAALAPLGEVKGVSFVSLQKGDPAAQAAKPPPGMTLFDDTAALWDFADTAALVEALDLVISVDTAVAHLAGALGKPVWLLNRYDTDWRWMLDRDDSPWYPSLRQFRQSTPGDWQSVICAVRDALNRLAAGDLEQLRPRAPAPDSGP